MSETQTEQEIDRLLGEIASRHLSIRTLTTRGNDARDIHEVATWALRAALRAAYDAGRSQGATI